MTDPSMLIVTFVYTVATIFICVFNYRSAEAARAQIELSKAQYAEDTRLKLLPCLVVGIIAPTNKVNGTINCSFPGKRQNAIVTGEVYFKITNIGQGIAKEITYSMSGCSGAFPEYSVVSMPVGDSRTICIAPSAPMNTNQEMQVNILYSDLLNHAYSQTFTAHLYFSNTGCRINTSTMTAPYYNRDAGIQE